MTGSTETADRRIELAERLAASVREQVDAGCERLDWRALQRIARVGPRQIDRLMHERYLTTAQRYMTEMRTERAIALLCDGHDVLNAALRAGFSGPGRLHDALIAHRGLTPGQVRRRGEGIAIAWGVFESPLGTVMLAATERGLAAVRLGSRQPLETHLTDIAREWPGALLRHDQEAVRGYWRDLIDFFEGRAEGFRPAIDLAPASGLQRAVWEELRRLEVGETVSYKELAARVGRPNAVRAVAGACAKNRLAIAIPCHRALRSDGTLAGFRWGVEWKRKLLALELELARRHAEPSATAAGTD